MSELAGYVPDLIFTPQAGNRVVNVHILPAALRMTHILPVRL